MPAPIITFNTTFNRTLAVPEIQVTDTTNYTTQVPPYNFLLDSTFQGRLRITYNVGSGEVPIYDNLNGISPDFLPDGVTAGGVQYVGPTIVLPLDTNGKPLPAEYKVTYKVNVTVDVNIIPNQSYEVITVNTYNYSMVDPAPCLEVVVNCLASSLSSTDDAVYDIQGATYTITRQHTLYPPPASGAAVQGPANLQTLIYSPIVTTTWTAECISTVTYTFQDGLIVIVTIEAVKEFAVSCDTNLSKILCCLINVQKEYEAMECVNPVKAEIIKSSKLDPTLQHLTLFLAAQQAGNVTKMTSEYAAIIEASGCGEDCGCGGDTPSIVQVTNPAAIPNMTYAVSSPLGTISVVPSVVGNVTTFNIDLSTALQNILNSVGSTTVSTTTPSFLSVTQTGLAPNYNYQVDFISGSTSNVNQVSKLLVIDPTKDDTIDYLEFTKYDVVNQGPNVNPVGSQSVLLGTTVPNQSTDPAVVILSTILDTNTLPKIVQANVMRTDNTIVYTNVKNLEAEVFYTDLTTGVIYIRFYNPITGTPYTLLDLKSGTWGEIHLSINIFA